MRCATGSIPEFNDNELRAYYAGLMNGVTKYAWWKDGVQYVGTGGKKHKDAIDEIQKAYYAERKTRRTEGGVNANTSQADAR